MSEEMVKGLGDLSPRLQEVLLLVAEGKTNQEIGDELSIKMETARNHVHLLARRIGVSGTPENRNVRVKLIRWLFINNGNRTSDEGCLGCKKKEEEIEGLRSREEIYMRVISQFIVHENKRTEEIEEFLGKCEPGELTVASTNADSMEVV